MCLPIRGPLTTICARNWAVCKSSCPIGGILRHSDALSRTVCAVYDVLSGLQHRVGKRTGCETQLARLPRNSKTSTLVLFFPSCASHVHLFFILYLFLWCLPAQSFASISSCTHAFSRYNVRRRCRSQTGDRRVSSFSSRILVETTPPDHTRHASFFWSNSKK